MSSPSHVEDVKELSPTKHLLLKQRLRGQSTSRQAPIRPRPEAKPIPLSSEQRQIWLHEAMNPDQPIYNETATIRKYGPFNLQLFEASLNEILRRHEIWRTSFQLKAAEAVQVAHPALTLSVPLIDLSLLPPEEREPEALRLATADAKRPFDLEKLPLLRAFVFRMGPEEHWLQLSLHHIIFDAIAIQQILVPELATIYAAYERGLPSPLEEPTLQYADYAAWQQLPRTTPERERLRAYWRAQVAGELPLLNLPADRSRPQIVSHRGATEYFSFPASLMRSLHPLARTYRVSVYMILLATLKVLLFRYSGQEDVIVGSLGDGRRRPELQPILGCFLDTFIVRTHPAANQPFLSYLLQVRNAVLEALDAAEVPFSEVAQMAQRSQQAPGESLIQVFLAFQPEPARYPEGWQAGKMKIDVGAAKFELYIEVEEGTDATGVSLNYSTDLFDADTIHRMGGHWLTLLTAVTESPETQLGDLPLLTWEEQERMVVRWNQTEKPRPRQTLHHLFEAVAVSRPAAPAVTFEGTSHTYAELHLQSDAIAAYLLCAGASRGHTVAVCLQRSQYLPAALLGVLKTGAAYLPLDPSMPTARKQLCLADAAPKVILTQASLTDELLPTTATIALLEDILSQAKFEPSEPSAAVPMGLEEPAYVIHTSGTTGRPKAVEISHRAVTNLLASMQAEPGFTAADTLLAVTTLSFDIAALEIFLPLITGGRVVIASREAALDPSLLADLIRTSACSVMQATPATWRALLDSGWQGQPGLRVFCGGEPLPRDLAAQLLAVKLEIWNLYGPTETTIWSTVEPVKTATQPISVGRPIANTTTYILDANRQPVPVGVAGDLYLGGAGLATCYRNQPELTAEKFTTPTVAHGARLYRTGDIALYRREGSIEVLGRADNQVKIRGFRIELEEIEAALAAYPGVVMALTKAWPDPSGGQRIAAYFVAESAPPSTAELRDHLATRLPDYMIPYVFVPLASLPLTPNNKLDRKALPPPDPDRALTAPESQAPAGELECQLAQIWSELLGISRIGAQDNFFYLGGHSLLVSRLQQRIATDLGIKVSMAALFYSPTLAGQASLLKRTQGADLPARILSLQTGGSAPRIFWAQPSPGTDLLVAALGRQQPFFGVTITREDLTQLGPDPDFDSLASLFAEAIVSFQPSGPYYLGGFCVGGILAYAIATHLAAQGREVASLILVDSENPVFYRRLRSPATELKKLWFYGRRALRTDGPKDFIRRIHARLGRLRNVQAVAETEMSAVDQAILAAALRYQPPAYDGNVLVILSAERPSCVDLMEGWRAVVQGRLNAVNVSGHHDDLLSSENVPDIAQALSRHLAQAEPAAEMYGFL